MSKNDPDICPTCNQPSSRCLCGLAGKLTLGRSSNKSKPTIELPSRAKSEKKSCKSKGQGTPPVKQDGIVRIGRSTKGRRGKGVTTVTGIPLEGDALKEIAQTLKGKCGAGGTVKDGVIEIQGEHRETLQKTLEAMGYRVKQSGG